MDGSWFDDLARSLALTGSRRWVLQAMAGAAAAPLLSRFGRSATKSGLVAAETDPFAQAATTPDSRGPWGTKRGQILVPAARWGAVAKADVISNYGHETTDPTPDDFTTYGINYQCVELVQRFYALQFGYPPIWNVSCAVAMWNPPPGQGLPEGLIKIPNGQSPAPMWGDVLVFQGNGDNGGFGHVAVVYAVANGRVHFVEQNIKIGVRGSIGYDSLPIDASNHIGQLGRFYVNRPPVLGWLHAAGASGRQPNTGPPGGPVAPIMPGGVWISPRPALTKVTGATLNLQAEARPAPDPSSQDAGAEAIDHVQFTYFRPKKDQAWHKATCTTQAVQGSTYSCALDLPRVLGSKGELWVSFDVYARSGSYNLAPNGIHKVNWDGTCKVPDCVSSVFLSGIVAPAYAADAAPNYPLVPTRDVDPRFTSPPGTTTSDCTIGQPCNQAETQGCQDAGCCVCAATTEGDAICMHIVMGCGATCASAADCGPDQVCMAVAHPNPALNCPPSPGVCARQCSNAPGPATTPTVTDASLHCQPDLSYGSECFGRKAIDESCVCINSEVSLECKVLPCANDEDCLWDGVFRVCVQSTCPNDGQKIGRCRMPCRVSTSLPDDFLGTWRGTRTQAAPVEEWPVTITFTGGGVDSTVGTVAYPSLGCASDLSLDGVASGALITTREHLTAGQGNCVDGGMFRVRIGSDGSLRFDWSSPGGNSVATGTLTRAQSGILTAPPAPAGWHQAIWEAFTISYPPGYLFSSSVVPAFTTHADFRAAAAIFPETCLPQADCRGLDLGIAAADGLGAQAWAQIHGFLPADPRDLSAISIDDHAGITFEADDQPSYPGGATIIVIPFGAEMLVIDGNVFDQGVIDSLRFPANEALHTEER